MLVKLTYTDGEEFWQNPDWVVRIENPNEADKEMDSNAQSVIKLHDGEYLFLRDDPLSVALRLNMGMSKE